MSISIRMIHRLTSEPFGKRHQEDGKRIILIMVGVFLES